MITPVLEFVETHATEFSILVVGLLGIAVVRELLWIHVYSLRLSMPQEGAFPRISEANVAEKQQAALTQKFTRIIVWLSAGGAALLLALVVRLLFFNG